MANLVPKNVDIGEKGGPKFKREESMIFLGCKSAIKKHGDQNRQIEKVRGHQNCKNKTGGPKLQNFRKLRDQNCN